MKAGRGSWSSRDSFRSQASAALPLAGWAGAEGRQLMSMPGRAAVVAPVREAGTEFGRDRGLEECLRGGGARREESQEPACGEESDLLERLRLFEEVRRPADHGQIGAAAESRSYPPVTGKVGGGGRI